MRRILLRSMTALALLAPASLSTGGCADNDSMLFIAQVQALDTDCVAQPDPSGTFLAGGVLDVALRDTYDAALLVGNQLTRQGSREQVKTETSRITLEGADVEVFSSGQASLGTFSVPATGSVPPSTGSDPGWGVMAAQLIPAGMNLPPGDYVVAKVRVFGTTLGGTEIQSSQLSFPITICSGCLVSFPADSVDPVTGACTGAGTQETDPICRFGQDDAVPCWLCSGSVPACRTPGG